MKREDLITLLSLSPCYVIYFSKTPLCPGLSADSAVRLVSQNVFVNHCHIFFFIYLHLPVYLCNLLYHQMLIGTGILENTLPQSSQIGRPVFSILLLKGCCSPVSRCTTHLGVLRALQLGEEREGQAQDCECSTLDF